MKRWMLVLIWSSLAGRVPRKIIVVGSGLAGLSAAIEASRNGAQVLILEKGEKIGGNSKKASSGINAACTPPQSQKNVHDSVACFASDTIKSGHGCATDNLVKVLAQQSADAWHFLTQLGVNLDLVNQMGGHSLARTHRSLPQGGKNLTNIGMDLINALSAYVENLPQLSIWTSTRVKSLRQDMQGNIKGISCIRHGKEYQLHADAVILATGGFCGQTCTGSFLAKYRPELAQLSTTNGACADGEGIHLGCAVGADVVDMEKVQIHPTGFVDPHSPHELRKYLAPESLRAVGGVLLNQDGCRFTDELGKRDDVTRDIVQFCGSFRMTRSEKTGPVVAYLILNKKAADNFGQKIIDFYTGRGLVQTLQNGEALANLLGIDNGTIEQTFKEYVQSFERGIDQFGKKTFPVTFDYEEPLYVMLITPCLHYTMGGLKFDEHARVTGKNGPIKNLYAAGEVTGGLHGANRLCGNSLLECVVFGRIAGRSALNFI